MRTPTTLKYLKVGLLGFFLIAGASAVYGIWWFVVASQFESGLDAWIDNQRSRGIETTYERRSQSGFPNVIHIKLENPRLVSTRQGRGEWSAEQLTLQVQPWAIERLGFDLSGRHQWQYPASGGDRLLQASAAKFMGSAELKNGLLSSISSHIDGLIIENIVNDEQLHLAEADLNLTRLMGETPEFKVRLRDILLPPHFKAPLGDRIGHFDAKGLITGRIEIRSLPESLIQWRDSGGTVDFKAIDLNYPPLQLRGDGTLALDGALQPVAALSVKAEGFFETIDALHGRGYIPLGTSFAAKIALGVLSVKPEGGGNAYLDLPISLQNQSLYAGSIKLLKLRAVEW